ncbi:MAG: hypothetical protein IJ767_05390 [Bacteroidaceae bacterium]|nr:hypothetical protein [Bacteroidaceae bacterium]
MEERRTSIITLGDDEAREIEPIIERINGLEELLMIVQDKLMHDQIVSELAVLESQRAAWWQKVASHNHREDCLSADWEVDLQSKVTIVPEDVKQHLRESKQYDYAAPVGDRIADYCKLNDRIAHLHTSLGGGDVRYDDFIYTDPDGIDHLVQRSYDCFGEREAYFGDKVLGYHQYSPYGQAQSTLPNGSPAPEIPVGFMEPFTRMIRNRGIHSYLQSTLDAVRNGGSVGLDFDKRNGRYSNVNVWWVGKISIEGFLYAIKIAIEGLMTGGEAVNVAEVQGLYNDIVREMSKRGDHFSPAL